MTGTSRGGSTSLWRVFWRIWEGYLPFDEHRKPFNEVVLAREMVFQRDAHGEFLEADWQQREFVDQADWRCYRERLPNLDSLNIDYRLRCKKLHYHPDSMLLPLHGGTGCLVFARPSSTSLKRPHGFNCVATRFL